MSARLKKSVIHRPDLNIAIEVKSGSIAEPVRIPEEPTIKDCLSNFAAACRKFVKLGRLSGFRKTIVSKEIFEARLESCRNCPQGLWDENARFGLGKCNHKKCGCTRIKLWAESEKCPIYNWSK